MPGLNVSVRAPRRTPTLASADFKAWTARLTDAVEEGTRDADRLADRAVRARLPHRGGFTRYMTGRLEVHRSKIGGGMRLTFDAKGTDAARINAGRLRHPLYGNAGYWYTQTIRPGFADDAMREVKAAVDAALERVARR